MTGLTDDGFLGGRLRILQPARGYRAGVDPVFLAAATDASPGESVLELGCGVGVVSLCLAARVGALDLIGVEALADYAALARRNASRNRIEMHVVEADVRELGPELKARSFDHVVSNPPYLRRSHGIMPGEPSRRAALYETVPLADWVGAALRRLRPGGRLTMIQAAERLPELLKALDDGAGAVTVRPIAARAGREADRFILTAVKSARGRFRLTAPLIVHEGLCHSGDGDDYAAEISDVLRNGAALDST
ncbi:tRNA1(Val) (adenine(37)-N6)-methyltransferase [Roseitranquillus sediminis]|uniref:tRNA1(Val) (adenine(37)-N6)-methyltransferase n=1 Tax=Roseitranquillus sediminis TaxID=2809051 RepID=UPI001D0C3B17|nr:methyltransferase [Roseitranquillus sediminis]MBM9593318.1 methyltransferase [Roseitranquillus sediminis]